MYIDFQKEADNFEIEHKICIFCKETVIRSVMVGATFNLATQ